MYGRLEAKRDEGGELALSEERSRDITEWQADPAPAQSSPVAIKNLVQVLLRWKWLFLAIVAFCVIAAAIYAATQTPLYRATATLELNPAPARVVQIGDVEEPRQTDHDFLDLQIGLIRSRTLAERVARTLGLERSEEFLGYLPEEAEAGDAAVGTLMERFSAAGTASDRILQVSFFHENPNLAARVANAYADQAVESNFQRALESTARSREFLQRQLESTREKLERSERELIAYARAANIVNVVSQEAATNADSAGGTLIASNLVALNNALAEAQNARIEAQQRYAQQSSSAQVASGADPTVQSLQQQRSKLQADYDQKLKTYLPDYPEMVSIRAQLASLDTQISQASGRAGSTVSGSLRAAVVAAQNRERELQAKINQLQSQLLDLNDRGVRYTILRRAVEANRSLYNALLAKLGEENTSATRTSGIAVVDQAKVPGAPFHPDVPRTLVLGLLGGLVVGTAGCVAVDRWKNTIDEPADLVDLGIPVLGVIPKLAGDKDLDEAISNPRSPIAEAYHSTRASLQFISKGGVPKSIFFTSARANEGKTSSVIAIAADFISVGMRVVVIDADLRRPSLQGRSKDGGLTSILTGTRSLRDELTSTNTPGLFLIHAGAEPADPTVLLASPAFNELIERLEEQFDVVIIDGPPVLGLADAPLIASVAANTVMVVESGKTLRAGLATGLARLNAAGARVLGGILTKYDRKSVGYGYSGYGYDYEYGGGGELRSRRLIGRQAKLEEPA